MNSVLHSVEESTTIRWQDTFPEDLYIPPAAFEILLENFEGPLDFLIYLIQKNNFDLLHLEITPIANQYLAYMDEMKSLDIELTADYMVMAALLADLKSRLLLPKPKHINLEKDPKQTLVDRLETYIRIKNAASHINELSILNRDTFDAHVALSYLENKQNQFDKNLLKDALSVVFNRPEPTIHKINNEPILLQERIEYILQCVQTGEILDFSSLLHPKQGKMGMVVTFMAVLELTRQQKIDVISTGVDLPLTIRGVQ